MREQRISSTAIHRGSLVLVNAAHRFRPAPDQHLVPVGGNPAIRLDRQAAALLEAGMARIRGWRGILPVSGWRSHREQQAIWDDTLVKEGEAFTRTYVAVPGHSEHQTGLAIDLGRRQEQVDYICPAFPDSGLCGTFRRMAAEYGFILRYPAGKEGITGIGWEPWHFRYVGGPHALIMEERGCTLEEYIDLLREHPRGQSPLRYRGRGWDAAVSFLPAGPGSVTTFAVTEDRPWAISGNNVDGFILTELS